MSSRRTVRRSLIRFLRTPFFQAIFKRKCFCCLYIFVIILYSLWIFRSGVVLSPRVQSSLGRAIRTAELLKKRLSAQDEIRIGFVGDITLSEGELKSSVLGSGFRKSFEPIEGILHDCAFLFGSLASVFTDVSVPQNPRRSFGHSRADPALCTSLVWAGFDFLSLANDHSLDYGYIGVQGSRKALHEVGIASGGAGRNIGEASAPMIVEHGSLKVVVLSLADGPAFYKAGEDHAGVWRVNVAANREALVDQRLKSQLEAARALGGNLFVVSVHWGPQFRWDPNNAQRDFAHRLIEAGVDIVWGHGSSHIQGIEIYDRKPIIYGPGRFFGGREPDDSVPMYHPSLGFLVRAVLRTRTSKLVRLEITPFLEKGWKVAQVTTRPDHADDMLWFLDKMKGLCNSLGTRFTINLSQDTLQINVDL